MGRWECELLLTLCWALKSFDIYTQPPSPRVSTSGTCSVSVLDATDVIFAELDTLL